MTATLETVAHEAPSARLPARPQAAPAHAAPPQAAGPQAAGKPAAHQPWAPFQPMPDVDQLSRAELEAFLARAIPADPRYDREWAAAQANQAFEQVTQRPLAPPRPHHPRDRGRFTAGNPGGPGRPRKPREISRDIMTIVANAISEERWESMAQAAAAQAAEGDSSARRWIYQMTLKNSRATLDEAAAAEASGLSDAEHRRLLAQERFGKAMEEARAAQAALEAELEPGANQLANEAADQAPNQTADVPAEPAMADPGARSRHPAEAPPERVEEGTGLATSAHHAPELEPERVEPVGAATEVVDVRLPPRDATSGRNGTGIAALGSNRLSPPGPSHDGSGHADSVYESSVHGGSGEGWSRHKIAKKRLITARNGRHTPVGV